MMNFMCRMWSLCCSGVAVHVRNKLPRVLIQFKAILQIIDERFSKPIHGNFVSTFCASHLLDLLAAAAYLINFEWHYDNTTPVNSLFSRDDFYCSVSHKWNNDKSKAVIGGVTLARKPSRKWELNSYWLTAGKECGSILSSRLWGGALRDDTKNGCVVED